jgi:hypothetical protein
LVYQIKSLLAGEGGILMKGSGVEEARELGGILIVLAYQLIVFPFNGAVAAAVSDKTASTRTEKRCVHIQLRMAH